MEKKKIVIKIGGSLNTKHGVPNKPFIETIVQQAKKLIENNFSIIMVVSGAIPVGISLSGDKKIKKSLEAQAWYSMQGQVELVNEFITSFRKHGIPSGQGLYTRKTLNNEFTKKVFSRALQEGGVIICNENDAVNPEELEGDNDFLAAKIAILTEAQKLLLLSQIRDGIECSLSNQQGEIICQNGIIREIKSFLLTSKFIKKIDNGGKSRQGAHGLSAKLKAAKMAAERGILVYILPGEEENIICRALLYQEELGTLITPGVKMINSWIQ